MLTGATIEMIVKTDKSKEDADAANILYSTSTAGQIVISAPASGPGVGVACLATLNLLNVDRTNYKWYKLIVTKTGRSLTYAFGKCKVIDV